MRDADFAALAWRKSSASFATNCVLVASHDKCVTAQDSADAESVTLVFSLDAWDAFLERVRQNAVRAGR
jgi:Domain of unknown function (DUF397)